MSSASIFRSTSLYGLVSFFLVVGLACAQPVVLFDNCHGQRAANADWTIYGGYSDMADAATFLGCNVESIDNGKITKEILKDVNVFVSPEPNTRFTSSELAAIREFTEKGGSLYLISDHEGADRNHNGWDAVMVLTEMQNFTGIQFNKLWFSEHPITGTPVEHQITEGVHAVGTWGGTSLTEYAGDAQCLMFESHGGGYIAKSCYKKGRIVTMGDASPYDDGTGAPGDKLYDGWNNPGFNHERLCLNSLRWLLGRENCYDTDLKAFGKLLENSSDSGVRDIQIKIGKAILIHEKTIRKCKNNDVKRTWQEDLDHLRNLKSLTEGGTYSKTVVERLANSVNKFKKLHSK